MQSAEFDRSVAMLFPPSLAYVEWEQADYSQQRVIEIRHDQMSELREVIEETANENFMNLELHEYGLPQNQVPSRNASKWIKESNMITAWNPNDHAIAYIYGCMRKNPLLTALLGYDEENCTCEQYEIFATQIVHLFKKGDVREIKNRTFVISPHTDIQHSKPIVARALLYPYELN